MSKSIPSRAATILTATLVVVLLLLSGPGHAQEVQIFEQWARANALAAAPCPPDHPPAREDVALTGDLTAFVGTAAADTASGCGTASAGSGIATSITDSTITVDFECTVSLAGHRYAEGGAHFLLRFRLTAPTQCTMRFQGSFAYEDTLTNYSCGVLFGDYHSVGVNQPTLDVTTTQNLVGGESVYTLEGGCNAVRNMIYAPPFEDPADGVTTLSGSVTLTFCDASIVAAEPIGWGDLKAQFR